MLLKALEKSRKRILIGGGKRWRQAVEGGRGLNKGVQEGRVGLRGKRRGGKEGLSGGWCRRGEKENK